MGVFPLADTMSYFSNRSAVSRRILARAVSGRTDEVWWHPHPTTPRRIRRRSALSARYIDRSHATRVLGPMHLAPRRRRTSGDADRSYTRLDRCIGADAARRYIPTAGLRPSGMRAALEPDAAPAVLGSQQVAPDCSRAVESPFILRSVMNRFTQKVLSGGIAAGLSLALVASANAQAARSGAWTLNAPEGEWHMTGRDYSLQRFSPLKQITTSNVAELRPVWSFSTGTLRGHEGNALVVGNVMYIHTSFPNIVYALDLSKPGAPQIWKHVPNQSPDAIPIACCDLVNRGLAYHPERQDLHPAPPG